MQSKRVNKISGLVLLLITILAICASGIAFLRSNTPAPAQAATKYLTVNKVFLPDLAAGVTQDTTEFWHIEETAVSVAEGDFVLLDTTQKNFVDSQNNSHTGREAIAIYFGGTPTSTVITAASIYYNDNLLKINEIKESDDDPTTSGGRSVFGQYLFGLTPQEVTAAGLNDYYITRYTDGTAVDLPEGRYTVSLVYFDTILGYQTEEVTFYITTQKTFNTVNENPTLSDTEKVDAASDTNPATDLYNQQTATVNYFNFNNVATTYYDDEQQKFSTRINTAQLYYPTLIYNPEKFDISFTRTLYNYRETVITSFSIYKITENGVVKDKGYLSVSTYTTEDPTRIIRRTYDIEADENNSYSIRLQFDKVGEYTITKTPKLKIGLTGSRVNFVTPANNIITANAEYLAPLSLIINGYVANYSNTQTTYRPLFDDTYTYDAMSDYASINRTNDTIYARDFLTATQTDQVIGVQKRTRAEIIYTADMTFANTNFVSNSGASTVTMSALKTNIISADPTATDSDAFKRFFEYNTTNNYIQQSKTTTIAGVTQYTKMTVTNLAPVTFEFYGKLYTGSATQYASWYAFRDTAGNVSVNKYTRGMAFDDAGEYLVYLTYENPIFSNSNQNGSRKHQYMHQIFCFVITNSTPTIQVFAQEDSTTPTILSSETAETIGIDGYTNGYVYAAWEKQGPFDAGIYCTYNVYDWDGNAKISGRSLNGLVYQKNAITGAKYSATTTATLLYGTKKNIGTTFGTDGYYQIQVFRTNNTKAFVNYTFNIDTAPISGIKALQVIGNNLYRENGSTQPNVLSSLDENNPSAFHLITNSAFGYTWQDKQSGAPITAQYIYASINKTTNFDLASAITGTTSATETEAVTKLQNMAGSGKIYMPTNASIGLFTPAMNYQKIKTDTLTDITATLLDSQIINTPQLAFLLLRDAAGNTAIFVTLLDNTNTQVLQVEKQASYVNVITKNTNFYWGTHKSLKAASATSTATPGVIRDIYDFVGTYDSDAENYSWMLNGKTFTTTAAITNAITALDITANNALNIPLGEVSIAADSTESQGSSITPTPSTSGSNPTNWYATIHVIRGATEQDPYKTGVTLDGDTQAPSTLYTLVNGEFRYQITVWDEATNSNAGGLMVEVNLDKSLGSLRSYWDYDGTGLEYNRNPDKGAITDRQYVANTYSTDRRYVAFSWTEPGESFQIESIVLNYYAFSNKLDSPNYPYSDTATKTVTLYHIDNGYNFTYDDGGLNEITYNSGSVEAKYYQTGILRKLIYSQEFENAGASEAGKYVITRTYKDPDTQISLDGDQMVKSYTYYIDRNTILPTGSSYDYGDEKIQFGYNKGDYPNYPDYPEDGQIIFDNYGLLTNGENFEKLSFDTINLNTSSPNNVIVKSNILPASVTMTTWTSGNETVYDKYYSTQTGTTNAEEAIARIQQILEVYKNSTRLQVAVQFFANNSTSQYALTSQTFYSTKTSTPTASGDTNYSRPLSDLQYAFREVGRYRVVLFDLSNFDGLLTGKPYTDFKKISYSLSTDPNISKNNLYPNCSVVNFELTGVSPSFDYQSGQTGSEYGPMSTQSGEQLTNFDKTRITWSDPSDYYTAHNAYNEVQITKTILPKGNNTSTTTTAPQEYRKYFNQVSQTTSSIFGNPIEITCDATVASGLVSEGLVKVELNSAQIAELKTNGLASLTEYIESLTRTDTTPVTYRAYFIKVSTSDQVKQIVNNGIASTSLQQMEYYKVRINNSEKLYNYYLLLPQAEIEDATKNSTKRVDTRYSVTVHYISKSASDYTQGGDTTYYSTTKELYQDYTAPYYNLVDLIEQDSYINSLGTSFKQELIANIDNPDSTFLKSFAFAVTPGFSINYRNKYESSTYYYYYKHTNYTGNKNEQIITQHDPNYSGAPMFVKNDPKFVRANYSGLTGYTGFQFTETGYYDIIEQDTAGNMRVYTIFVTDNAYAMTATNNGITITADNTNIMGKIYNSAPYTTTQNLGFTITDFTSADQWLHFELTNFMNTSETLECYLVPQDAYSDVAGIFDAEKVFIGSTMDALLAKINAFLTEVAINNDAAHDKFGSQIRMFVDNRTNNDTRYFSINTPGKMLINSEQDFLSLISTNASGTRFTLKMPNTISILSTKLTTLETFLIESDKSTIPITSDANYISLPTTSSEFESNWAINTGYTFSIANNTVYKFTFVDNFGRTATYSYPIDSSLIKELHFAGNTKEYTLPNNQTYTFTSNDVDFVYQATGLNISISITDLATGRSLYSKDFGENIDTESDYFTYIRDSLSSNIITLRFVAKRSLNNLVNIEVNSGTDVSTKFSFVMYTIFPQVILSDKNGSPIQNNITSKAVMLTWQNVDALFNPFVQIILPNGTVQTIESGYTVSAEGVYTVRCVNDIGPYVSNQIVFTIQEYLISIYGVYQITASGQTVQLLPFTNSYAYTTMGGQELRISQYMFLSNDSSWERNISVICNEDKDLEYSIVEEFGNTRIYYVHGKDKGLYQIEIYFAVTRIPSLNVSTFTNFRINGDSTNQSAAFYTDETTVTWNTNFADTSSMGHDIVYPNFFALDLTFNGTYVGRYTTGLLKLINSGIYTITIVDPVGQKHYFGSTANATAFSLTILTNVIYNVNGNAAIPYATYSDPVDFYVPMLASYDYTPVVTIYRNNALYSISPNSNGHYTISTPGSYKIVMKTSIERVLGTTPKAQLEAVYQFNIVSPNEAIPSFDFAPIAGYEIISIIRLDSDTDITADVRGENARITSLHIDPEGLGVGKYQITVQTQANGYNPSQTYTFAIWVNNETVIITPSREWGSNSTAGFTLTINTASVYERIGECQIVVNGTTMLSINASNKDLVEPTVLNNFTAQGDYIVQLVSASGTVLQSYRLTIDEPLNTAAIILICVAVGVVVVLTVVFIIMRRRVKVR